MCKDRLALFQLGQRLLKTLPNGISLAFSYGSGVFRQQGQASTVGNVIDYMLVVDKPHHWHRQNLVNNAQHYSFLKYAGGKVVHEVQDKFGAGVYFNTLLPFAGHVIKYGVISKERLVTDLLDWDTLYVSGRLQKPVLIILNPTDHVLISSLQQNLFSAVHAALLMLPEQFSEVELFTKLAGLSYQGDFRMIIGEDKNKVENLVKPNLEHFNDLYSPILSQIQHVHRINNNTAFQQDGSGTVKLHRLNLLPKSLQQELVLERNKDGRSRDMEDVLRSVAFDSDCSDLVGHAVHNIVQRSSISQSLKGIITAGISKSIKYSSKKVQKMILGYRKK